MLGAKGSQRVFAPEMSSLASSLALIGMLLPLQAAVLPASSGLDDQWAAASIPATSAVIDDSFAQGPFAESILEGLADDAWNQVRIEQRMIIRIAPRMPGSMFTPPPGPPPGGPPPTPRFYERKADKCLPIASIAGVQIESSDRLLLVTRNRKLIGASLDKSCRARDFYSGFYVERNEDGRLCAGRDTIHSRAGANCAITKMRELVPDDD